MKEAKRISEPLKWEWVDSLTFIGSPTAENLEQAVAFGRAFGEKILGDEG